MRSKPLILVIDDLDSNLQVAGRFLVEAGYEVSLISDGEKGIQIALKIIPDLILLDLVMPGTNGFDVCTRLKADERTKEIPIIFLTSMKDTDNIIKGFTVGAVDYIVKPANKHEALARIKTHLDLRNSRDVIIEQNKKLKDLFDEKRAFLEVSSNQLLNPINSIRGYNDHIKSYNLKNDNSGELQSYNQQIDINLKSVSSTINDFLYLYNLEDGNLPSAADSFNVNMLIRKVVADYDAESKVNRLKIIFDTDVDKYTYAVVDKEKLEVILGHILSNSIKYSPFFKSININATEIIDKKKFILIEILDQGVGMTENDLQNIFEKYSNLSPVPVHGEQSVGLGMYIVKKLIDEIGGRIQVNSELGVGTSVKLLIPAM